MAEFWEQAFKDKQIMWGEDPTPSAVSACEYFRAQNIQNVLIPGIGYGRNAKPFLDAGMNVTGIEISQTAIDLAKDKMELNIPIHHGSVSDMPFDDKKYDGIFCYAVIHLLPEEERRTFIEHCYAQLKEGGSMIFTAVSTKDPRYGQGAEVSKNRYENSAGVQVFFYDEASIRAEFGDFGLVEIREMSEHHGNTDMQFLMSICSKPATKG